MTNNTQNALTDFDFCLALSQKAINSQMKAAWKAWKRCKNLNDTIKIFKTKKNGQIVDVKYGLEAQIAPLTISLNVKNALLSQVEVTLTLQSGKVVYYDEDNDEKADFPIENWSFSFITDLDKKPVDLDILATIDPDASRTAKDVIDKSTLPDSVFSIEYLFLNFTKVDLLLSDNKNVKIPDSVPELASIKAKTCLNFLLQGDLGDFMLGTVVRRNNKQATPTFALTDFIFHINSNSSTPDASTLSYLGMLAHNPMPDNKDAARILLKDPWVLPENTDGTKGLFSGIMAISKKVFMVQYLIPKFSVTLGIKSPESTGLVYPFKLEENKSECADDWNQTWYDNSYKGFELNLTIKENDCKIALSGKVWSRRHIERWNDWSKIRNWNIDIEGHTDFSGHINFSGNNIGRNYELTFSLVYQFSEYKKDREEVGGWAKAREATGNIGKFVHTTSTTLVEDVEQEQKTLKDQIEKVFKEKLKEIQVDVNQQTFIPPGGGVFTFQNPRFSQAGDLIFDVIYQAP